MSAPLTLPNDLDAEKAVICSLFKAPDETIQLCSRLKLTETSFHHPAHTKIWKAASEVINEGQLLDFLSLATKLRDQGNLEKCGGAANLTDIITFMPTVVNMQRYAEIVVEKQRLRAIILICEQYARQAADIGVDTDAITAELQRDVNNLMGVKQDDEQTNRDVVMETLGEVMNGKDDTNLIKTGIQAMDDLLKMYRYDLAIVAGATSSGKSALVCNMAVSMALTGNRGIYFSLEMSKKQVIKRMMADTSGHSPEFVRKISKQTSLFKTDKVTKIQQEFVDGAKMVIDFNMRIIDSVNYLEQVLAICRAEHAKSPLDFIVIDYVQIMGCAGKFERRQLQIAYITRTLKMFAKELNCLTIIASQVNKSGEAREAGDIEQDASAVVMITCDEQDVKTVTIKKQREGQRYIPIPLEWSPCNTKFHTPKDYVTPTNNF